MNERYNRILHNIFIYGLIATVSFLTFAFIITSVNTNLFLSIAASILLLILLKIANVINWEALRNIIFLEVPITVGFVIAKLYQGVPIDGICDYAGVADKHSFLRVFLLVVIIIENLLIIYFVKKGSEVHSKIHNNVGKIVLYPERESDLERLELYISDYSAVGVNGIWGSGKTVLADELKTFWHL